MLEKIGEVILQWVLIQLGVGLFPTMMSKDDKVNKILNYTSSLEAVQGH
jgi:hypothetical protein